MSKGHTHSKGLGNFGKDFLSFLSDQEYIEHGVEIDWIPKVRVILCNDDLWNQLWGILGQLPRHNLNEYMTPIATTFDNWNKTNGSCWAPLSKDETGKVRGVPEDTRLEVAIKMGFPRELLEELRPCDALIFLHESNLRLAEQVQRFYGEATFPSRHHSVVAHECIHIMDALSGKFTVEQFDSLMSFEAHAVVHLIKSFVDPMTLEEFKKRYCS